MSRDLSQKDMLIRLMDKMDSVEKEQAEHHTFSRAKLESIEAQAIKTNGRVSKLEQNEIAQDGKITKAQTIFATLATLLTGAWAVVTFIFS